MPPARTRITVSLNRVFRSSPSCQPTLPLNFKPTAKIHSRLSSPYAIDQSKGRIKTRPNVSGSFSHWSAENFIYWNILPRLCLPCILQYDPSFCDKRLLHKIWRSIRRSNNKRYFRAGRHHPILRCSRGSTNGCDPRHRQWNAASD